MARRDIDRLQGEIEELFADLWQVPRFAGLRHGFRPAVDCYVTDDPHQLNLLIELAGVEPGSIEIAVDEQALTISGDRARPRIGGQVYQQAEIEYGHFERLIPLGHDVAAASASRDVRGRNASHHAANREASRARPYGRDRRPQERMSADKPTKGAERMRLPVLPLKETVVFPESMTPLAVGQERSIKLIDDVVSGERMLALMTVRNTEADPPGWDDLYSVGTVAVVHKMIKVPDGTLRILVQGLQRVRLVEPQQEDPYLVAELEELPDIVPDSPDVEALTRNVQQQFAHIIGMTPYLPEELQLAAANVDDPSALCHLIASTLRLKTDERQELLEMVNVEERLRAVSLILSREVEMSELGSKIQSQVASEIDKGQREFFLRQQLKAIQDELGEGDEQQAEINELRGQLEEKNLPEHVLKAALRELSRLEKLPSAAAEYGVIRTYLDWIISLPWNEFTEDDLDLEHARQILDEDHFDLEKVKDRIVEYLAVSKLKNDLSGPVLCFVGPPGCGQDLTRPVGRARPRQEVRADLGRRRPRRVGDPRAPAHLHRRDAGHDHPRDP